MALLYFIHFRFLGADGVAEMIAIETEMFLGEIGRIVWAMHTSIVSRPSQR